MFIYGIFRLRSILLFRKIQKLYQLIEFDEPHLDMRIFSNYLGDIKQGGFTYLHLSRLKVIILTIYTTFTMLSVIYTEGSLHFHIKPDLFFFIFI